VYNNAGWIYPAECARLATKSICHLNFTINAAQAMMKAPIDKMYTHKGSFPAGTIRRDSDLFWDGLFGGAE